MAAGKCKACAEKYGEGLDAEVEDNERSDTIG